MWQDVIPQLVRALINDLVEPFTYSESRLSELVLYAAYLINEDLTFDNTYTINLPALSISPDPSSDEAFVRLTAMKAAIIVLFNELKTASSQSIRIVDGPAQIELADVYKSKKDLYDLLLRELALAKTQHQMGGGKAIVSGVTNENFGPYLFG